MGFFSPCCLVVLVYVWWGYVCSTEAQDANFNLVHLKNNLVQEHIT